MTDRSVVVRLRAEVAAFQAGMAQAAASAKKVGQSADQGAAQADKAMTRLGRSMSKNRDDFDRVGTGALVAGGLLAAGLGLAAKAAIDWESAWAGVTKTVEGTPAQMAELESGLRGLAQTLPATHAEIAGVAEAAGQLGVKRADILDFTKTMIAMGVSTNLSADEAATSMAQISNVMGTLDRDGAKGVERMGATIVALGNAGASTEKDIVQMATRLSGAGKLIGASESDVLALANAMSSVGIEAMLGGGTMSRVMQTINSAVLDGGQGLKDFAAISGVSAQDFAAKWASDPVAAIDLFVKGLGGITASGGDAVKALDGVGIKGTENTSVLLRLSGAGDILNESLTLGAQAWSDNTALADEAGKRYATTASQLKIARNNAKDAAIDFGSVLAPAIAKASGVVAGMAKGLADLPAPVQGAIVSIAGVGAASLIAVGGGIKLVTTAMDMGQSLGRIANIGPKTAKGIDLATGAAKRFAAVAAVITIAGMFDDGPGSMGVESLTSDLLKAGDATDALNKRLSAASDASGRADSDIRNIGDALKIAFDPGALQKADNALGGLMGVFGQENVSEIAVASKRLGEIDSALAGLVAGGNADEAKRIFTDFAASAAESGYTAEQLKSKLPGYGEALAAVSNEQAKTGSTATDAAGGVAGLGAEVDLGGEKAKAAAEAFDKMVQAITALGSAFGDERASASAFEQAFDDTTAAIKENGKAHLDAAGNIQVTTDKGRALEEALRGIATNGLQWAANMATAGASQEAVTAKVDAARDAFIKQATAMDIPKKAAEELANRYGLIPDDVKTLFEAVNADKAKGQVDALNASAAKTPPTVTAYVSTPGAVKSNLEVYNLNQSLFHVPTTKSAQVSTPGATASRGQVDGVRWAIDALHPKSVLVTTSGTDAAVQAVANLRAQLANLPGSKTVRVHYALTSSGGRPAGTGITQADGGILSFADGGRLPRIGAQPPQIQPNRGPRGIQWAETGAGPWEAFISGHPGKAERSRGIADDVVARLGGTVMWGQKFADGGVIGGGQVNLNAVTTALRDITGWSEVASAQKSQADAIASLAAANKALAAARKTSGGADDARMAAWVRGATNVLATANKVLSLTTAEYSSDRRPTIDRASSASGAANKSTKAFLDNIDRLTAMGFKVLALNLLDMGGPEAESIAAQAVKSATKAKALQSNFVSSAGLSSRESAIRAQLTGTAGPTKADLAAAQFKTSTMVRADDLARIYLASLPKVIAAAAPAGAMGVDRSVTLNVEGLTADQAAAKVAGKIAVLQYQQEAAHPIYGIGG